MKLTIRRLVSTLCILGLFALGCDGGVGLADSSVGADGGTSDAALPEDATTPDSGSTAPSFPAVGTGLDECYGQTNAVMSCPAEGESFYGQDGQYDITPPAYEHNAAGDVVHDLNTQLSWERAHHDARLTYSGAVAACGALSLDGHDDWRLPSIRELFSLADFRGSVGADFYLDATYFDLALPTDVELTGTHAAEMMGQTWSSTVRPDDASRGYYFYNFLDGHIKSAPDGSMFEMFYRCVRGREGLPENEFEALGDGTVADHMTGLQWQQDNAEQSGGDRQFDWQEALAQCAELSLGGHDDWRLPDVKELQSIVDYTRIEPSLDAIFAFEQASGTGAFFWSSTSMINYPDWATYVCFGPCLSHTGMDIHGPGAQRADPKWENGHDFSAGVGDQQDVVQIQNYVRCVR